MSAKTSSASSEKVIVIPWLKLAIIPKSLHETRPKNFNHPCTPGFYKPQRSCLSAVCYTMDEQDLADCAIAEPAAC